MGGIFLGGDLVLRLKLEKYSDVVLTNLVNDYRQNFDGQSCRISTNYRGLKQFEVAFYIDGLPHLLGLQYVSNIKYGNGIIKSIEQGKITAKSIERHHEFNKMEIRKRILLYPFLYETFIGQSIKICVPTENMQPNPQKLEVVFTKKDGNGEIVLGLRRDKKDGIFKPATLHPSKKQKYTMMKCSRVESIIWN